MRRKRGRRRSRRRRSRRRRRRRKEEEEKVDSLHTGFLELYPELIAYPCLFDMIPFITFTD